MELDIYEIGVSIAISVNFVYIVYQVLTKAKALS